MRCATVVVAVLGAAVLVSACTPHVHLTGLPASATPPQRVGYFMRMRPTHEGTLTVNGDVVSKSIILADGTKIVAPEDLEPLVDPDSETMRLARASVGAREMKWLTYYSGAAIVVTGFFLSGLPGDPPLGLGTHWYGTSMMIAGTVVWWFVSGHYKAKELRLRQEAFGVYTRDLGARLEVCAHGTRVVACEEPLEPAPDPFKPPPPRIPATSVPDRTALRMRD